MSGRIPQQFIDELIARADIIEVIGSRVPLKKGGKEYKACCPFHDEKSPSFTVVPDKQFYHCFGCGAHGTALGFLMEYDHLSFVEAVEDLAERVGLEVPREHDPAARPKPADDLYQLLDRVAAFYGRAYTNNDRARAYAENRGLQPETIERFRVGYAPDSWDQLVKNFGAREEDQRRLLQVGLVIEREQRSGDSRPHAGYYDRFRDRLMFPIRDSRGRTIGFGGRIIDQGEPKYLNSPETELFHKGRELYGLHEARQATRQLTRLLVVEGYMDVVRLHQAGVTYAVATLGTATTPEHLTRIFRVCNEVVFCFDGDRAGRAAAWRALETATSMVKQGRQIRFLFLPEGHDPDTLVGAEGRDAFESRMKEALSYSDYFLRELASRSDIQTVDGRAQLAESARPLLARMPASIYRELLVDELAKVVRMTHARLETLLGLAAPGSIDPPRRTSSPPMREAGRSTYRQVPTGRGSLVRQAVRILVHHPSLAAKVAPPSGLDGVERPGIELLNQILSDSTPCQNTGMLLERWREHPNYRDLAKLAAEEYVPDEAGATQELQAALERLTAEDQPRQRTQSLLDKQRDGTLSADERKELQILLSAPKSADTGTKPKDRRH